MREMFYATGVALLALLIVTGLVSAGQFRSRGGGGGCGPNGCNVQEPRDVEPDSWEWRACELPNGDNRFVLWHNGRFHGFWDAREKVYREYLGGDAWGPKIGSPPQPLTPRSLDMQFKQEPDLPPLEKWQLNGVDVEEIDGKEETVYSVNGLHVTHEQADDKLLADDSLKLWLIVNGTGREKVLADLKADPSFAGFMKRTRVWSVPAEHFSLFDRETKKPIFNNTGNPSITLMGADRTILFEQDGYHGPSDLEGIRKADPETPRPPLAPLRRDPPKPIDPSNPLAPLPFNPLIPLTGVAALGGLWFLNRKAAS